MSQYFFQRNCDIQIRGSITVRKMRGVPKQHMITCHLNCYLVIIILLYKYNTYFQPQIAFRCVFRI